MLPFWLLPQMIRLQHKLCYINWQQIIHVEHRLHEYLYPNKSFDQKFLLFWDTQKNLNMKQNWRKPGLLNCISQKLLIFDGLFRSALIRAADVVSLRVYEHFQAHQCQHRESQCWAPQICCSLRVVVQAVRILRLQHPSGLWFGWLASIWTSSPESESAKSLQVPPARVALTPVVWWAGWTCCCPLWSELLQCSCPSIPHYSDCHPLEYFSTGFMGSAGQVWVTTVLDDKCRNWEKYRVREQTPVFGWICVKMQTMSMDLIKMGYWRILLYSSVFLFRCLHFLKVSTFYSLVYLTEFRCNNVPR